MKIKELAESWEKQGNAVMTKQQYAFCLPIDDAAKIAALAQMYPKRSENEIMGELISAALDELLENLPY